MLTRLPLSTLALMLGTVALASAPDGAPPAALPFTAEEDADGARSVWFVLNRAGFPREYEPCQAIPKSEYYREVDDPRPGDIIWWPKFMALYDPSAPAGQEIVAAGGRRSLRKLEAKYGKPKFFRVRANAGVSRIGEVGTTPPGPSGTEGMIQWIAPTVFIGLLLAMLYWYIQVRRKAPRALFPKSTALVGVRGWLLFLCIILVFLYPLSLLRGINFRAVEEIQDEYPRAMTIALIDSFVVVALIVYSIYTGIRLWRVRPRALANAKRFLLVAWIYFLTGRLAIFVVGFPKEVNALVLRRLLWQLPMFSVLVFGWWEYLTRSKRVAATYRAEGTQS